MQFLTKMVEQISNCRLEERMKTGAPKRDYQTTPKRVSKKGRENHLYESKIYNLATGLLADALGLRPNTPTFLTKEVSGHPDSDFYAPDPDLLVAAAVFR